MFSFLDLKQNKFISIFDTSAQITKTALSVTLSKKAKSELVAGGPAGVKSGQIWVEPSQKFCISLR